MSDVKERGILFSAAMVRALLAGTKTQTRRVLKLRAVGGALPYVDNLTGQPMNGDDTPPVCPYGVPGDRLWVRETWAVPPGSTERGDVAYRADLTDEQIKEEASLRRGWTGPKATWKPGIHMFRWASRLTLEVTEVRVHRIHEITDEDAIAEGVTAHQPSVNEPPAYLVPGVTTALGGTTPLAAFARLWIAINGSGSWAANPWVWAVSFRRLPDDLRVREVPGS